MTPSGGFETGYSRWHNQQIRFTATATTQIGIHQVEFGGEYEQRTNRFWSIGTSGIRSLARWFADGNPEALETGEAGFSNYGDIPFQPFENRITAYGYSYNGLRETDNEDLEGYVNDCGADPRSAPQSCYDTAPWEPIFYGGYIQDKIEFRDIILNLGLRVDVFDNNTRILADPFSRLPLVRAGEVGGAPSNIGNDYAVYFLGNDVAGYRDLDGNFYDVNGQQVQAGTILLTGAKPRNDSNNKVTEEVYKDYKPQVTWMPRIGVSFPVTDQSLFFARYGIVAQRPSSNSFASLTALSSATGRINNNALEPEETVEYELGFRQRLGARTALTISGFFRQIKNLIQLDDRRQAFPQGFSTFDNKDFGTVKGFEFDFDLRRTNGLALNANYTLSFAAGTGSSAFTTSTIVWIDETPPNFISPLDFDQRHRLNISLDYRLGQGEGPTILGGKLLENFGFNILATAGSGFPYTPVIAFVWVQNLLDQTNVNNVWRFTGLPDDDGFLATSGGRQFLEGQQIAAETLYHHRNRSLGNVGIPRLTRIGVRLDF